MTGLGDVVLSRDGDVVTAIRGQTVVGFLHLRAVRDSMVVETLFVDASARGAGVGRALWRAAEGTARAGGAAQIVVAADPLATGFYRAMGCVMVETGEGANAPSRMAKPLS